MLDSVAAQDEVGFDRWPIAGFFVGLGFFTFFFLQKVLAPMLGLGHTHNAAVIRVRCSATFALAQSLAPKPGYLPRDNAACCSHMKNLDLSL